jgi:hypothetical protein
MGYKKTMINGVFWDVTLCGCCKTRRFGGMYRFHYQYVSISNITFLHNVLRLLVLHTHRRENLKSDIIKLCLITHSIPSY